MNTSKEIETAFRRDLEELLFKYDAEIDLIDVGDPYLENYKICVTILSKYNCIGEVTDEFTEFLL